ncbi:hypothetical protein D9M68_774430 [compost metagenome]
MTLDAALVENPLDMAVVHRFAGLRRGCGRALGPGILPRRVCTGRHAGGDPALEQGDLRRTEKGWAVQRHARQAETLEALEQFAAGGIARPHHGAALTAREQLLQAVERQPQRCLRAAVAEYATVLQDRCDSAIGRFRRVARQTCEQGRQQGNRQRAGDMNRHGEPSQGCSSVSQG